jgi:hypothetical protein
MATTTNYSWTTPDDTDLVKDGAAAIRTLGSSADTTVKDLNPGTTAGDIDYYTSSTAKARVAIGTAGQVLKVNAGGTAPEWATTADQTPLTTKGDLFTFDTADARIGVGADGTVLTAASGEATGLQWAAPAGGKLLQVVSATTTTSTAITSTVYTDTTITATITPTLDTSKIFIMISASLRSFRQSDGTFADAKLLRNAVELDSWTDRYFMGMDVDTSATENNLALVGQPSITYMDSPASTSALTYKLQGAVYNASASSSATFQINSTRSTITLFEIGV